jgi:hypothetical protein
LQCAESRWDQPFAAGTQTHVLLIDLQLKRLVTPESGTFTGEALDTLRCTNEGRGIGVQAVLGTLLQTLLTVAVLLVRARLELARGGQGLPNVNVRVN